ncbi:membrane protein insertase YidC [Nakamurella leprariae]|uniref:Membrane protein insertase YidC n=1 Tax=Nakamurella leprariae TaxID=2803911 RepID=A0A938YJJ6_9ACTN|nr:membrane protein insertase YidC [Nakamurella leprariae]MBM9468965.1 membrane protein insertase YidC [Nakamurella leprariae]
MNFNFWSLDYIYYPVSGIMWVWHKVFGSFLGESNVLAWVLSVVFLVFTLRAILFKPFMKQMDSQLKMQAVQPEMKKLREKYKDDRQRLTEEMMKLNKEAGVNPLASCLPILIQAPVFIGLFHVLRMFAPVEDGSGGWTLRQNVYFFGASDVESFSQAHLPGGAPLVGSMTMASGQLAFLDGLREAIIIWGIPLTILAGIATHLTSRRSVNRQKFLNPEAAAQPQAAIMNKVMLYLFPLGVIATGPFFPLAILFYWLANNSWTFGQLWVAHRIQDKRKATEAQVVEEAKTAQAFSKPKPGAKPKTARPVTPTTEITAGPRDTAPTAGAIPTGDAADAGATGSADTPGERPVGDRTKPRPGARPQNTRGGRGGRPPSGNRRKSGRR